METPALVGDKRAAAEGVPVRFWEPSINPVSRFVNSDLCMSSDKEKEAPAQTFWMDLWRRPSRASRQSPVMAQCETNKRKVLTTGLSSRDKEKKVNFSPLRTIVQMK